jgi:type VI secretion system secreted protein VgrG
MINATQDKRQISLETSLGKDALLLIAMYGTETLGRLYQYELELMSEGKAVDHSKLLGKNVTVNLAQPGGKQRHFNGIVSKFSLTAVDENQQRNKIYSYRATVVPQIWLLTRIASCRIFQEKTVPQIVESVLRERGYTDIRKQLMNSYRSWEYCVQYRETDFNFISRLMENEGIYYYFEHESGKHTLVLCDAPTAHKPAPGYSSLKFDETDVGSGDDYIWNWVIGHEIQSGKVELRDYNFITPGTSLSKQTSVETPVSGGASLEIYDYPGGYTTSDEGKLYAEVRSLEAASPFAIAHGTSSARGIFAGCTFKLSDHPVCKEEDDEYLITSISYQLRSDDMGAGVGKSSGEAGYECQVTCMRKPYKFHPPRITPKPVVQGPQTALVTGPSGEEIYLDKYGRVKVQFPWDREGKKDEKSSCWVRVSQNWAGKRWGIVFHPRIGQEVIVEFLEGDPDRPIITGRVYNAENMPPYALPQNQTQSGIKSRSSLNGTTENYNEIMFEDKKGSEKIVIHAEKDQSIEVEHDEAHWVGHDRTKTIDHDETTQVKHDRTETVDNDETITIHGNRNETVDKDETITIAGNRSETVDKDETITIAGNRTETVQKDENITLAKNRTTSIGEAENLTIGKDRATSIAGKDELSVGKTLTISAADEITLITGDASIVMKKDGTITIKGKDITLDGSGKIAVKASGDVTVKGSSIKEN